MSEVYQPVGMRDVEAMRKLIEEFFAQPQPKVKEPKAKGRGK